MSLLFNFLKAKMFQNLKVALIQMVSIIRSKSSCLPLVKNYHIIFETTTYKNRLCDVSPRLFNKKIYFVNESMPYENFQFLNRQLGIHTYIILKYDMTSSVKLQKKTEKSRRGTSLEKTEKIILRYACQNSYL